MTDLMHHPLHNSPDLNLIAFRQLNPSKVRVVRHKTPHDTFSNQPLHQEFSTNHSDHNVVRQRVNGFVHDQYITRMNPGIDNGCSLYSDKEGCGGVLDEEFVQVNGLVYGAVSRE